MTDTTDFDDNDNTDWDRDDDPSSGAVVLDEDAIDRGFALEDTDDDDGRLGGYVEDPTQAPVDYSDCCCPPDRPSYDDLPGGDEWAPNGSLVLVGPDGSSADFGPPTLDINGDGVADSTLVQGDQGTTYLMMDLTGDSAVDGAVVVDGAGNILAGFTIDENGEIAPVDVEAGLNINDLISGDQPEPDSVAVDPAVDQVDEQVDEQPSVQPLDPTDVGGEHGPGANVILNTGGEMIDLGAPNFDATGDGVNDAVLIKDDQGRPAYIVAELAADGNTDYVAVLDPATGAVIQQFGYIDGDKIEMDAEGNLTDPNDIAESHQPTVDTTGGDQQLDSPEYVQAPGATMDTSGNYILDMGVQIEQKNYDIAAELWFGYTHSPYPRNDNGQPLAPPMVVATLLDSGVVPAGDVGALEQIMGSMNAQIDTWVH